MTKTKLFCHYCEQIKNKKEFKIDPQKHVCDKCLSTMDQYDYEYLIFLRSFNNILLKRVKQ